MPKITNHRIDSPIGPLTLVNTDGVLSGLYMHEFRHGPREEEWGEPAREGFEQTEAELREYFDHRRAKFSMPLLLRGTDFQQRVWAALREIPFGRTTSYAQLAETIGNPKAVRAVGLANGRNPISIVVPCHRVIGSDGSLTGYGGGLERKSFLLEWEGIMVGAQMALL